MYHTFFNTVNPDSTFFGRKGRYAFVDGKYTTDNPEHIKDLSEFFKFEKAESLPVEKAVEPKKVRDTELLAQIPKSWTIARIYEYADSVGIQIPDNILKLADIKMYVEAFASSAE